MTISLLTYDATTGIYGAAATTGNLCVGGWVLRGGPDTGLSASQGALPSTLWGETVLSRMRDGASAEKAVAETVAADPGRAHRQLAALDPGGGSGVFTGEANIPAAGARRGANAIAAGNMLADAATLDACLEAYLAAEGPMPDRLLTALDAAAAAGGDARGLRSAALLVAARDAPPLDLRIDHDAAPLAALRTLLDLTRGAAYRDWVSRLPTPDDPHRARPDAPGGASLAPIP